MATINDPTLPAQIARVGMGSGMTWGPQHVVNGPIPVGTGGSFRLAMQSTTMAVSLGASAEMFQFRYVTAAGRLALVHRVSISSGMNVAATTAALLAYRMTIARAWTAAGSGGARASLVGNLQKMRTGHQTSEVNDAGISTTAALTAGTKTLDTQDIGSVAFAVLTGAITVGINGTLVPKTDLFGAVDLGFPLILGNQEGFVIRAGVNAHPAGMTWNFGVDVAWTEVEGF